MPAETLPSNPNVENNANLPDLIKQNGEDIIALTAKYTEITEKLKSDPENPELKEEQEKFRNSLRSTSEQNSKFISELVGDSNPEADIEKLKADAEQKRNLFENLGGAATKNDTINVNKGGFVQNPKFGVSDDDNTGTFGR